MAFLVLSVVDGRVCGLLLFFILIDFEVCFYHFLSMRFIISFLFLSGEGAEIRVEIQE